MSDRVLHAVRRHAGVMERSDYMAAADNLAESERLVMAEIQRACDEAVVGVLTECRRPGTFEGISDRVHTLLAAYKTKLEEAG